MASYRYRGHPRVIPLTLFLCVNPFAPATIVVSLIRNDVASETTWHQKRRGTGNDVALTMANVAAVLPFALPPAYLAVGFCCVGIWLDSRRLDVVNDNGLFTGGRDSALTSPREQCGRK